MTSKADSAAQAKAVKDRALPAKESGLFRQLLQHYEAKQHKQGIKAADQILKKFPNHGETLAIKSLVIHSSLPHNHPTATSQPKGEEANRLIATALRKDPYSHITHHVHSIILRADKDFVGAAEALRKARAIDPDNIPLIRDSISLYTQLKYYKEAQDARQKYHALRPNMKANWVTLAVGYELCGEPEKALDVYASLRKALAETGYDSAEKAELSMHVIGLMIEVGQYKEALEMLRKDVDDKVLPPISDVMSLEATIYQKLDQKDKAEEQYRKLIELNPDNVAYYGNLMFLKGIDFDSTIPEELLPKALTIMDGFAESYPRASAPRRLILDIVSGDEFRSRVKPYMQKAFEKGIPSLFSDLKGLCLVEEKQKIIQSLAEEFRKQYEAQDENSEALLWTYYFIASSISHRSCPEKDYVRALELLDTAGKRHPTVPEILFARGHVLKRAGDLEGAARALEQARLMDKSDRFLNGKSGKYWLRAGQIEKAQQVFGLFTKKDAPSPGADLKDMQCSWYIIEEGDAYRRAGNLPMAVKRYEQVIAIYQEFEDDEYDFHTYSLRKLTLNAYKDMLKFDKEFRSSRWFTRASASACEVYAMIQDDPSLREVRLTPEEEAERKKAAKKAQKAGSKAKKAAATAPTDPKKEKEEPALPDADPVGAEYLKEVDPLDAMERLVQGARKTPALESWLAEFDLALRKKQYARSRLALAQAYRLASDHPKVHEQAIRCAIFGKLDVALDVRTQSDDLPLLRSVLPANSEEGKVAVDKAQQTIDQVAKSQLAKMIPADFSPLRKNAEYIQQHREARRLFAGARSLHLILSSKNAELSADDKRQIEELIMQTVSPEIQPDLAVYKQALAFLSSPLKSSDEVKTSFVAAVRKNLPLAFDFKEEAEITARREAWAKEDEVKASATTGDASK